MTVSQVSRSECKVNDKVVRQSEIPVLVTTLAKYGKPKVSVTFQPSFAGDKAAIMVRFSQVDATLGKVVQVAPFKFLDKRGAYYVYDGEQGRKAIADLGITLPKSWPTEAKADAPKADDNDDEPKADAPKAKGKGKADDTGDAPKADEPKRNARLADVPLSKLYQLLSKRHEEIALIYSELAYRQANQE